MKTNNLRPRGFTLVELLVVIVIIAALAGLSAPMILNARKAGDRTEAVNNARQLGTALFMFDEEYGSFPDNDTATMVQEIAGSGFTLTGNSSNDYLRQLIANGNLQSEEVFFAKTTYTRKPDNVVTQGKALEPGEVGFGYIMLGQGVAQSTAGNPGRPVLATPLLNAQTDWTFDPDPFDGRSVVLKLDNSVGTPRIRDRDKNVPIGGGKLLQSIGDDTVWGTGSTPTLVAPQKRGG